MKCIQSRPARRTFFLVSFLLIIAVVLTALAVPAGARRDTDRVELQRLSEVLHQTLEQRRPPAYYRMLESTDPATRRLNEDPNLRLMYFDARGLPTYYITHNLKEANFIRTDHVWPGGLAGLNLSGNTTAAGELAIWDGGAVRTTHQEFGGRVTQMDTAVTTNFHATHVAGTMIAAGVDAGAKGMSFEAPLHAYEWDDDLSEMAAAAAQGLRISNHSYGLVTGWYRDGDGNWYWFGDTTVSTVEDYRFGFYSQEARDFDEIAYNAPYYLIVKSAGNDRDDAGPAPGTQHYHVDHNTWTVTPATDTHPDDGAAPDGEDTLPPSGCAKNVLTVGSGYYRIGYAGLEASSFSSAGPTDDGRIKPDIVADGNWVYSCTDASDTSYDQFRGTSMAAPSVAGSINLLADYYEDLYGKPPLSSTMKAIVLRSADTGGEIVPSPTIGWGKMDTRAAAELISAPPEGDGIMEATLHTGEIHRYYFNRPSGVLFGATLVWTDPPGNPPDAAVDPPSPNLVNDLDMYTVRGDGDTTRVTVVDWNSPPPHSRSMGDNSTDNVERLWGSQLPGDCQLIVSAKGPLQGGEQTYSLVWSGFTPRQPQPPSGGIYPVGAVDLGYPGAAPSVKSSENEERGIFFTAIRGFDIDAVGFKVAIPCENTLVAKLYSATGTARGGLLASGTVVSHAPGEVFHYVPLNYTLEPCQDYELTIEYGETIRLPTWHKEMIEIPYDAAGVVRVTNSQWNGNTDTPVLAQFALAGRALGEVTTTDLEPTGIAWDTSTDTPGERGIFVTAEQTATLSAVRWGASVPRFSSNPIEASIYEADGTTRGALIARSNTAVFSTSSSMKMFTIPINATLVEGKDYNFSVTFDPSSFQMKDESAVTLPYSIDDLLTVVDGEAGGDPANTLLTHFGVNWSAGAGGTPHDLAKAGAPSVSGAPAGAPGILVDALVDEKLYSIGWMADVPEGAILGARLYEFISFHTAPVLIAEGEIVSTSAGMRWHDIPVAAELAAGEDYILEMVPSSVNAWESWSDASGMPYQRYGVIDVVKATLNRTAAGSQLPHARVNLCNTTLTGVDDRPVTPPAFFVSAPYPNPASGATRVDYTLDEPATVWMSIYDVAGRRVATVLDGAHRPAGAGTAHFDTSGLPAGIYFLEMRSPSQRVARKIAIVK